MSASNHIISVSSLPSEPSVTFEHSSFFTRNGPGASLPSPSDVLSKAAASGASTSKWAKRPICYESLGLVVKFGREPRVTVAEAQCLWALGNLGFPVPELYGWRQNGEYTFLYMEHVQGVTLEAHWESMGDQDRVGVCEQLRCILNKLRCLQQEPSDAFVGHINRGHLLDVSIANGSLPPAGPFLSVSELHDWLSLMIRSGKDAHWPGMRPDEIPDPYRRLLDDDARIVFTHGDLHRSNIIISPDSPSKVLALIDWQQSGWYPDYWEYMKAEYTANYQSEWVQKYLPVFVDEPSSDVAEGFSIYTKAFGH